MANDNDHVNSDEKIVTIREIEGDQEQVFYCIRDVDLDYWRSTAPFYARDAWTKDRRQRAEFSTYTEAVREMQHLWLWRCGRDEHPEILDEIPFENSAA
jgi:hypothetical protein